MKALLHKIRGGILVDVKLLDTAKVTNINIALVTFVYERSAKAYEDHTRQYSIVFGSIFA